MAAAVLLRRLKPIPGDRAVLHMVEFTGQDAANDGLRLVVGHPGERQGLDLCVVVAVFWIMSSESLSVRVLSRYRWM